MRTFTVTNTNGFVFGFVQDRVVMANREGCAPARPHLTSHDWLAKCASLAHVAAIALKRLAADAVTGAVRLMGSYCPSITGPQLCRLPVLSTRQRASVRG